MSYFILGIELDPLQLLTWAVRLLVPTMTFWIYFRIQQNRGKKQRVDLTATKTYDREVLLSHKPNQIDERPPGMMRLVAGEDAPRRTSKSDGKKSRSERQYRSNLKNDDLYTDLDTPSSPNDDRELETLLNYVALGRKEPKTKTNDHNYCSEGSSLANNEAQTLLKTAANFKRGEIAIKVWNQLTMDQTIDISQTTFTMLLEACLQVKDLKTCGEILSVMETRGQVPGPGVMSRVMELYKQSAAAKEESMNMNAQVMMEPMSPILSCTSAQDTSTNCALSTPPSANPDSWQPLGDEADKEKLKEIARQVAMDFDINEISSPDMEAFSPPKALSATAPVFVPVYQENAKVTSTGAVISTVDEKKKKLGAVQDMYTETPLNADAVPFQPVGATTATTVSSDPATEYQKQQNYYPPSTSKPPVTPNYAAYSPPKFLDPSHDTTMAGVHQSAAVATAPSQAEVAMMQGNGQAASTQWMQGNTYSQAQPTGKRGQIPQTHKNWENQNGYEQYNGCNGGYNDEPYHYFAHENSTGRHTNYLDYYLNAEGSVPNEKQTWNNWKENWPPRMNSGYGELKNYGDGYMDHSGNHNNYSRPVVGAAMSQQPVGAPVGGHSSAKKKTWKQTQSQYGVNRRYPAMHA